MPEVSADILRRAIARMVDVGNVLERLAQLRQAEERTLRPTMSTTKLREEAASFFAIASEMEACLDGNTR